MAMGILRSIFGPSRKQIWKQMAREIGAEYDERGMFRGDVVRYQEGEWELVLDTYTVTSDKHSTTYTRMRAPFVNKDGLYFRLYREGAFSGLGRFFGMQDLTIGDSFFDDQFVIKGNDQARIAQMLRSEELKDLIRAQPRIRLEIKDDEGWFGTRYPEGVDVLSFTRVGVPKDIELLKSLFDLFACMLERLVQIDSAYEDDPRVRL